MILEETPREPPQRAPFIYTIATSIAYFREEFQLVFRHSFDYNAVMQSILIISVVFVAWAVIHSIFADYRLKARFRQRFGDGVYRWYRLGYNLFATLSFVLFFLVYWQLPDQVIWVAPTPWNWGMRGLQLAGLVGLVAAVYETNTGEYAGLAQLRPGWNPDNKEPMRLSGLYCLVRHPIYFFSLPIVWFSPVVTVNGLTIAILFTLYFYFGAKHEETGLRAEFGPAYDVYRQQVPMLLPRPKKCSRLRVSDAAHP